MKYQQSQSLKSCDKPTGTPWMISVRASSLGPGWIQSSFQVALWRSLHYSGILSSSVWWECDSEMCPQPVSARAWLCDWSILGREVTEGSNNKGWEKRESKPGPLVLRGAEICRVTNYVTAERAGKSSGRENGELGCQRAWPASAECEAAAVNCLATETAKEGLAWQRQPTGRAAPA